jgi:NTE family protein
MFNLVDFTLSTHGIIKADKVLRKIQTFIPDQNIEDLPIKFAAVTTDLSQHKEVVLTNGSLFEAIRASISIPLVITPAVKNETLFVDGGVLNPVPVNRVFRHEGDILIAVNVNAQIPYKMTEAYNSEWRYFDKLTSVKLKSFQKKLSKLVTINRKDSIGYFHLIGETTYLMLSQISKLTLETNPPDLVIEVSKHACGGPG